MDQAQNHASDPTALQGLGSHPLLDAALLQKFLHMEDELYTDSLTGARNREWLKRVMDSGIIKGFDAEGCYAFMADMNGLKSTNDVYGHLAGDQSLDVVGHAIREALDESEHVGEVFRYGGDEFLVVAWLWDDESAEAFERQIREKIAEDAAARKLVVTPGLAMGYVALDEKGLTEEQLRAADKLMYAQKNAMESGGRSIDLFKDEVTGLPNSNYFNNAGDRVLTSIWTRKQRPTVIFCDVRHLGDYNTRHGYMEGNALLRVIGAALAEEFPGALVARLSGDHFVIVCSVNDAGRRLERANQEARASAREGYGGFIAGSYDPVESDTAVMALDRASQALHYCPKGAPQLLRRYGQQTEAFARMRSYVLGHFMDDLSNGRISVAYQPALGSMSGKVVCTQATRIWRSEDGSLLEPGFYLPILKEKGMLHHLDEFVLDCTCREMAERKWRGEPYTWVNIHLSEDTMTRPNVHQRVTDILQSHGIHPRDVGIIVSGHTATKHAEMVAGQIGHFHDEGYPTFVDVISEGGVALETLVRIRCDWLRVDVTPFSPLNDQAKTVLAGIAAIGKRLGRSTLAIGVQTEYEYKMMRQCGFDMVQGSFICNPCPASDLPKIVADRGLEVASEDDRRFFWQVGKFNIFDPASPLPGSSFTPAITHRPVFALVMDNDQVDPIHASDAAFAWMAARGIEPHLRALRDKLNNPLDPNYQPLRRAFRTLRNPGDTCDLQIVTPGTSGRDAGPAKLQMIARYGSRRAYLLILM